MSKKLKTKTSTGFELTVFILSFPTPHGDGRCLVNVFTSPSARVFVLSEIKSNPISRVMDARIPEIAETLQNDLALPQHEQLSTAEWYTHHGPFSYHYMELGPSTFTTVPLGWNGTAYTDPVEGRELLTTRQKTELVNRLGMPSVESQLKHLGEES
ncbi:hypothetical protein [Nocardiopsis eucommiae]|uniref:hypothetical protein n=1 Tax=Nocardiopsis eucommiae TaxID=2831970 RepID=UPI003D71A4B3